MSIVYDELEFASANHIVVHYLVETCDITPRHIFVTQDVNSTDIIKIDATKIFTEKEILYFTLGYLINVQTIVIKNFDINHTLVKWRDSYMNPTNSFAIANNIAHHWEWNLINIINVDSGRRKARINSPLDHTRGA